MNRAVTAGMGKSRDIRVRAFEFAVEIVKASRELCRIDPVLRRLVFQLVDAAGSIGANLEEAAAAQSKRDFVAKNCIALKEARESNYWLKVIARSESAVAVRLAPLTQESGELMRMVGAAVKTARSNPYRGDAPSAEE